MSTQLWRAGTTPCKECGEGLRVKNRCHEVKPLEEFNKVRGLLCASCNTLIGMAGDDLSVLLAAVEYLQAVKA